MWADMTPFWETKRLSDLTGQEWESLCAGCAKCCVHKLEDEDTGDVHYTCVACRMLDVNTCRCTDYPNRHETVPDCAVLSVDHPEHFQWMPETCAYRRLHEGRPLPDWHPLIIGDPASMHAHGASAHKKLIPECLAGDDLEKHIVYEA
ncbi:MAG: YcgN family cysteine cluster protein [Verrucomicrobia bacterium]|nr:MAG: YcgN family cysteine cluster protein [Verrucomicrobiota bacterium]